VKELGLVESTSPNRVGLVIGALVAGWHLVWVLLILCDLAQQVLNFVFWAHMIQPVYTVRPFDSQAASTLIAVTFFSGYVLGFIGALIWNQLHRTP
jgi:hypothetical protein